jgi:hypothetical protein
MSEHLPLLSSHWNDATAEDASVNQDFGSFGPAEDTAILEWVNRIGNHSKNNH